MNAVLASLLTLISGEEHGEVHKVFGAEMARYLGLALGSPARTSLKVISYSVQKFQILRGLVPRREKISLV